MYTHPMVRMGTHQALPVKAMLINAHPKFPSFFPDKQYWGTIQWFTRPYPAPFQQLHNLLLHLSLFCLTKVVLAVFSVVAMTHQLSQLHALRVDMVADQVHCKILPGTPHTVLHTALPGQTHWLPSSPWDVPKYPCVRRQELTSHSFAKWYSTSEDPRHGCY